MKTNSSISLNQGNLKNLPESIFRPTYDRSKVTAGIMHIGVGGFHRAHQAFYTDDLLSTTGATEWGICGVGLREADRKIADILKQQDYLYTLIIKHPDGRVQNRVIGSLIDFMLSCDDPKAVTDRMANPETKIVSLTITEGGYNFNPATGEFDFTNADVQHDLTNPESPKMVFGYLTEAFRKRRAAGISPFTVQSCDNIQHNGNIARKMLLAFAWKQDPEIAKWIENEVCFPNAMVDRITPVTTAIDIDYLENEMDVKDGWPVTCEPFTQWVIEDKFSDGRPSWEKVGAQFVQDVTPYEKMKLRLLNAGHIVLGFLGSIHGYETIDECVSNDLFSKYLRTFMDVEATPTLDTVEGVDLDRYKDTLLERFSNPNIKDKLVRICLEGSSKLPVFLIPTLNENLKNGGSIKFATLVIAAWCLYSDSQKSLHGKQLEIIDEMRDELHKAAAETPNNKLSFLKIIPIFGDLINNEVFVTEYKKSVSTLYKNQDISELMKSMLASTQ